MEHNERLELALRAGAKAIRNNWKLHGTIYVLDPFGTPSEIPYLEAAQILQDEADRLLHTRKPVRTFADHIRAMSDQELAELLSGFQDLGMEECLEYIHQTTKEAKE